MSGRLMALTAAGVVAALTLLGCAERDRADISPVAAQVLSADVDAVTAAARAGDATRVQEALATLREHVDAQEASGELSSARAERILAAGARVALDVGPPAPQVVVETVPVPAPEGDDAEDRKGRGRDDGKEDKGDD